MERINTLWIYILFFITSFNVSADNVTLSVDVGIDLGTCDAVNDSSVIQYLNSSCQSSFELPSLPAQIDVDALHVFSNKSIIFSINTLGVISGLKVSSNDLILFDGNTYSLWLTGETIDLPQNINIDAVSIIGDDVYFSVDSKFKTEGVEYFPSTIIKYNQGLTIFMSNNQINLSAEQNIDALQVYGQDEIYYSLDTANNLEKGFLARAEIAKFVNNTTTEYFSPLNQNDFWYQTNIDAISIEFDLIFKNNFE